MRKQINRLPDPEVRIAKVGPFAFEMKNAPVAFFPIRYDTMWQEDGWVNTNPLTTGWTFELFTGIGKKRTKRKARVSPAEGAVRRAGTAFARRAATNNLINRRREPWP